MSRNWKTLGLTSKEEAEAAEPVFVPIIDIDGPLIEGKTNLQQADHWRMRKAEVLHLLQAAQKAHRVEMQDAALKRVRGE